MLLWRKIAYLAFRSTVSAFLKPIAVYTYSKHFTPLTVLASGGGWPWAEVLGCRDRQAAFRAKLPATRYICPHYYIHIYAHGQTKQLMPTKYVVDAHTREAHSTNCARLSEKGPHPRRLTFHDARL